jgi:hypothetical protein
MKWMLAERKPGVLASAAQEHYLGRDDAAVPDTANAVRFDSRETAEAHRRKLKHPYNWVTVSASD